MPIATALRTLRDARQVCDQLIASAHSVDQSGTLVWPTKHRTIITEAAVQRLFVAWESFLEETFWHYLVGALSATGRPLVRFAQPSGIAHANKMLVGANRFVDWSATDIVRKLAGVYFKDGEPYETVLKSVASDIADLKVIRNATAHTSASTSTSLDGLSSRKLQTPVVGMTPYVLVTSVSPSSQSGATILQEYEDLLDAAAVGVANG